MDRKTFDFASPLIDDREVRRNLKIVLKPLLEDLSKRCNASPDDVLNSLKELSKKKLIQICVTDDGIEVRLSMPKKQ